MKKEFVLLLLIIVLSALCFSQVDYNNAGMEYTDILVKNETASARVTGFKKYIQKYTDTSNQFVILAYYQLSMNLFRIQNFSATVSYGNKLLKMGGLGEVEKAHLLLAMGNAYAVKSASVFSIDKAKKHCLLAKKLAQQQGIKKIVQGADTILRQLVTTSGTKATLLQKIRDFYGNEEYNKVIALYNTLSAKNKNKPYIHKYYAFSLLKAGHYDPAVKELKMVFRRETTGLISYRIGEAYAGKRRKNAGQLQEAIEYFLQAGWLYSKEKQAKRSKNAFKQAKYWLFEKRGYNKERKRVNMLLEREKFNQQKNALLLRKKRAELRKLEREARKSEYEPPKYLTDKISQKKKEIKALESGVSDASRLEVEKLKKMEREILKEFSAIKKKSKTEIKL